MKQVENFDIKTIRVRMKNLNKYWVVIFGSFLHKESSIRSDIDIAIITKKKDQEINKSIWLSMLEFNQPPFDIKIFETLPLPIQINIIENFLPIFGDVVEISEYFYFYRKLWKDLRPRYEKNQFKNIDEKLERIKYRKKHR